MVKIGILGYGVVGSGVYEVLQQNNNIIAKKCGEEVEVKRILDLREFPNSPISGLLTKNYEDILNDDEIKIVVEVMGGVEPAYTFAKSAIEHGKSVVTSNKALVAVHGANLINLAKKHGQNFLFEASVGGGIPVIRPFNQCLTADNIISIKGILNGTTNYILTKMDTTGESYEKSLLDAQNLGYAEKDPTADVDGHDTCRKIAILTSLAVGKQVDFNDVTTIGIRNITSNDFAYAKKLESSIKLIGSSSIEDGKISIVVEPTLVKNSSPLYMVNDVFNAILVKGDMVGDVMFYGQGAGKLATASSVVGDVLDIIKSKNQFITQIWSEEKTDVENNENIITKRLIRITATNLDKAYTDCENVFGKIDNTITKSVYENIKNEFAFIYEGKNSDINEKIKALNTKNYNVIGNIKID